MKSLEAVAFPQQCRYVGLQCTSYKLDLDMVSGGSHACVTSLVTQAEDLSNSHSEYVTLTTN